MAYTVAAVAIPTIANALDAIPVIGSQVNLLIDNIMVAVAGMVIANFILLMISQVKSSDWPSNPKRIRYPRSIRAWSVLADWNGTMAFWWAIALKGELMYVKDTSSLPAFSQTLRS